MIEVSGLTRYYGDRRALDGLSFRIESNQIVGFLGLNGAGKSTTLKVLAGLILPTSGSVRIDGRDIFESDLEVRRHIGYLPEDPPLYPEMTARDFLYFAGQLRGMSVGEIDRSIDELARRTSIHGVLDQVVNTLSHGYKKRVGIAQSIIHKPRLVILDEPTSNLDPVQVVEMREVVRNLRKDCTVLISSHNLAEISQTCDRILVLHGGHLVAQGSEEELAERIMGGYRVELVVRGSIEILSALLSSAPEVQSFEPPVLREKNVRTVVTLRGDTREDLVRRLVEGGIGVRSVTDAEAELEHIFLELTRGNAA